MKKKIVLIKVFQKHLKMSFPSSSRMDVDRHSSVHLGRHKSHELHHTIHSDIPFLGMLLLGL